MDENPYQSPQKVSSPPTAKAGVAMGVLLLLSIPAGCICGGITCFSVGVTGQATGYYRTVGDAGYILGIPIGLIIAVLVPILAVLLFGKPKKN